MPNALALETSPYLLQHQHNPVDWLPWGEDAFERARARDVPILLSVGYATCHWCHVMAHESFENPEIARQMNADFVCVKVDREERPDVDRIYMTAVQAMSGSGGWPMTVFLRPDGKPFYAGTYYPPEDRYGRSGFPRLLASVAHAWREKRAELDSSADYLTEVVQSSSARSNRAGALTPESAARALSNLEARFDAEFGGFGDAPKFPAPTTLEFLLMHFERTGSASALEMALSTLEKMALSGLYDQLGGGFHRYSVDRAWRVPHFEKMLYDNAQLVRVYLHAFQLERAREEREAGEEARHQTSDVRDSAPKLSDVGNDANPQPTPVLRNPSGNNPLPDARSALFERVVRETLAYLEREMRSGAGGFYCAQDADSEGIEGKFFVWTRQEVREVLGEDAELLVAYYGVTEAGNFSDPHHPDFGSRTVLAVARPELLAQNPEALERGRARLLAAREQRVKPGTDDKVLTSWNGLALAAFAEAARVLDDAHYLEVALGNAGWFWETMRAGEGRLHHTHRAGQSKVTGLLEDLSLYGLGLIELYKASGELRWLGWARELHAVAVRDHWDEAAGMFYSTAQDGESLIARLGEFFDSAVMSDNASSALLGLWLDRYFSDPAALERTEKVIAGSLGDMLRAASGFGGLWQALKLTLSERVEIVLMGDPDARRPIERELGRWYLPHAAIAPADGPSSTLPLLEGRSGQGVAYVCKNLACELPAVNARALRAQLAHL